MKSVSNIRSLGRVWLMVLTALNTLVTIAVSYFLGGDIGLIAGVAAGLGLGGFLLLRQIHSATQRAMFAIVAQGQVAVFVAAFAGHPWQIDAHMHFFATMGILILLVDYRAIVAGAAAVAVHHLALNFVMPELVYPGGSDLGRTVMHAVILVLATVALAFCSWALDRASIDAETLAVEREEMVERLSASIGTVVKNGVDGDFTTRIEDRFADTKLQAIVDGTNELMTSVDKGVSETNSVLFKMAEGDFTARMDGSFTGAFAQLQNQIAETMVRLRDTVADIGTVSDIISDEATKIASGSQTLSDQATQQAASIEETSASIQTLTDTVRAYDGSVQKMSERAAYSLRQGQLGEETVQKATSAMATMADSADRINEVVTMMSEISFQTSLLALNASVEAARAGEAGRGFAIVAQEVRALAKRSSESEDEIRQLISASAESVGTGVQFVDELGATLSSILNSVEEVANMASEMSDNTKVQATYMSEISSNVSGIDQHTQKTALTAEAYLKQSNLLKAHSDDLKRKMGLFVIEHATLHQTIADAA